MENGENWVTHSAYCILHTKINTLCFKSSKRSFPDASCFFHSLSVLWCFADHHHLGGGQAGVCAEGRDRRERLDPLGGGRWASSGKKTSVPAMNINAFNLDTLIQIQNASQRCMWRALIFMWDSSMN